MPHHPVLSCFKPFSGEVPADYHFDFLGTRIRHQFVTGFYQRPDARKVEYTTPIFDEEHFEWVDLLESVVAAKGSYTMMELGAGFGRWSVRAAFAVEQYHNNLPYHLIAAEAEPLKSLTKDYDADDDFDEDGEYCRFPVRLHRKTGWRSICVPGVTLAGLLKGHDRVDLIDLDLEGQELPSIRSAIKKLNAKVKRLHIGTHGREIEAGIREVLSRNGWCPIADYPVFSTSETPWGPISFQDGVQSWVNPRL